MQASSRTHQSMHRSHSFEFLNSNSTTVTKQHSKVENSKLLYMVSELEIEPTSPQTEIWQQH